MDIAQRLSLGVYFTAFFVMLGPVTAPPPASLPPHTALSPLAIPIILTPYGVATLTLILAGFAAPVPGCFAPARRMLRWHCSL